MDVVGAECGSRGETERETESPCVGHKIFHPLFQFFVWKSLTWPLPLRTNIRRGVWDKERLCNQHGSHWVPPLCLSGLQECQNFPRKLVFLPDTQNITRFSSSQGNPVRRIPANNPFMDVGGTTDVCQLAWACFLIGCTLPEYVAICGECATWQ